MEFSHGSLFRFLIPALVSVTCSLAAQSNLGMAATMQNFALPEYKKGGTELLGIIYGRKAQNLGAIVNLEEPVLDIVRRNTDIFKVKPLLGQPLYPFGADSKTVQDFWSKHGTSQAVVTTPGAEYDKNTQILRGDDEILFLSPELDLQGKGFDADVNKRLIHIRSNVKVIIRSLAGKKPANKNTTQSTEKK